MRYSVCALIFVFFTPPISLAQESSAMPAIAASAPSATPAFYPVPELMSGFNQLYEQKFDQARVTFSDWHSSHPDEPFGEVPVPASFLFEDLYRHAVLTSDFFLNSHKFLHRL